MGRGNSGTGQEGRASGTAREKQDTLLPADTKAYYTKRDFRQMIGKLDTSYWMNQAHALNPGTPLSPAVLDAVRQFEEQHTNDTVEHGLVLSKQGTQLGTAVVGNERSVNLDGATHTTGSLPMNFEAIQVHNHPAPFRLGPSTGDLYSAINGHAPAAITTGRDLNGKRVAYVLQPPPGKYPWQIAWPDKILTQIQMPIFQAATARTLLKAVNSGHMTMRQASDAFQDLLWRNVSRVTGIGYHIVPLEPGAKDLLGRGHLSPTE